MIEPSLRIVTLRAGCSGWIALLRQGSRLTLVGSRPHGGRHRITTKPQCVLWLLQRTVDCEPIATDDATSRAARRALARWARRSAAAGLVGPDAGADTALRRALRRRIDAALRTLPLANRGLAAEHWSAALYALLRLPGAGMTFALRRLLRASSTPLAFTTGLESLAATCAPSPVSSESVKHQPARLVALVILRGDAVPQAPPRLSAGNTARPSRSAKSLA